MSIRISYKDGQDWINKKLQVINWDNYAETFKDERVQPNYVLPEIITDVWNGTISEIQNITFDAWYLEIRIKESEVQSLNRMQSCSDIIITDLENGLTHVVETQKPEWFIINEPERIEKTSNWKFSFIYRTNKTVINKFAALSNVVALVGGVSTYYSKYEKITLLQPVEDIVIPWSDGFNKLVRQTNKTGFRVLLYMDNQNMSAFKNDYNANSFTIDTAKVFEKLPLEIFELGEDNYRINVSVITNINIDNTDLGVDETHDLDIDSGTHFFTDYPTIVSYEIDGDKFDNEDGVDITSKSIAKKIVNVKLWLNEVDMNSLVTLFAISTDIEIDSVVVLENREVNVDQLSYDLYQCEVECLTVSTPAYPL